MAAPAPNTKSRRRRKAPPTQDSNQQRRTTAWRGGSNAPPNAYPQSPSLAHQFPPLPAYHNGAAPDSPLPPTALIGSTITVSTRSGQQYEGVLVAVPAAPDADAALQLKDVRDLAGPENLIKDAVTLPAASVSSWGTPADADISSGSAAPRRERELQAGQPDDATFGPGSTAPNGSWDQFAATEQIFGVTTSFDEETYPTRPPAAPAKKLISSFRDFVLNEKQRLVEKRQAIAKNERDKRMSDLSELVKFSQNFQFNEPIPDTNPNIPAPAERITHDERSLEPFSRSSPLCLDGQISDQSKYVLASGGYADVYTGSLDNKPVAIKVMRPFSGSGSHIEISKIFKRLWREYLTWSQLSHTNILDCLGFSYDFSPQTGQPSLVSPWMSNGTAMSYIKEHRNVDRVEIVVDIARGLAYLHNMNPTIVHGDLRAGNVLVSDSGVACLSDFGLSRSISETRGMTTSSEVAGSVRWMAPELLRGSGLSVQSDVWAYGMTVLEILTGTRPYRETTLEAFALLQIINGEIPTRPNDFPLITDYVWTLCQNCWKSLPERPSINVVLRWIEGVHRHRVS